MTPAADPVAARIAELRQRDPTMFDSCEDWDRLLDIAEAAHDPDLLGVESMLNHPKNKRIVQARRRLAAALAALAAIPKERTE